MRHATFHIINKISMKNLFPQQQLERWGMRRRRRRKKENRKRKKMRRKKRKKKRRKKSRKRKKRGSEEGKRKRKEKENLLSEAQQKIGYNTVTCNKSIEFIKYMYVLPRVGQ